MTAPFLLRAGSFSFFVYQRVLLVQCLLFFLLAALCLHGLMSGSNLLTWQDVTGWMAGNGLAPLPAKILIDIRLPVVLTALGVGGCLGAAGAVFQSVSRNSLGSPDILGFTSGAATGAVYHLVFISQSPAGVAGFAFLGGCFTALVIYLFAIKGQVLQTGRLVLVGIGTGATLTAFTGLLLVKGDIDNAMLANLWLLGSLDGRQWGHVFTVMAGLFTGLPVLMLLAKSLRLTEMGDAVAFGLGVNVQLSRHAGLAISVLMVSLATAAAGPMAFIALGAPHIARALTGLSLPLFTSSLCGAVLLLTANRVSAVLPLVSQLPAGRVTAILGGVYLIVLLLRQHKKGAF